jgi:ABC-2 type transport system permease protein
MLKPSVIQSLGIILIPLLYVIAISSFDFFINLFFTKLNWTNEQEAVKNSASTMLSLLAGIILPILFGACLVLLTFINVYLAVIATIMIVGLFAAVLYFINVQIIEKRMEIIEQ